MLMMPVSSFAYDAGIMLDAFAILLCSKLCWHNWLKPSAEDHFTDPFIQIKQRYCTPQSWDAKMGASKYV